MRKLVVVLAAAATFMAAAVASQAAVTTNTSIPLNLTVFIPCANGGTGESVTLSGGLHVLITFTVNGNNVSGKEHFQPQGISGTGSVTGDKYQGTGVTQDQFGGSFRNGRYEETFINNFRIIGQGPGNNYLAHETFHITINANGDVTATQDNLTVDCK